MSRHGRRILRFACGAESPPIDGSLAEYAKKQVKTHDGYAIGHRRHDGRYRVVTFDTNGGVTIPKLPDGRYPGCLSCPVPKKAGRRQFNAKPEHPTHGRRIVVACYPEEVSGLGVRCECCEREAVRRCVYDGQPPLPFCQEHYDWHIRTAHTPQLCGCPDPGEHRRLE